jgi:hypothetical protein
MIEVFKTHCILPDETIGEVCKKLKNDNWLVCNNKNWWECSSEWIKENVVKS